MRAHLQYRSAATESVNLSSPRTSIRRCASPTSPSPEGEVVAVAVVVVGALPSCVAAGRGVRSLRRTVERLPLPRGAVRWPVLKRILTPVTVGSEKKEISSGRLEIPEKIKKSEKASQSIKSTYVVFVFVRLYSWPGRWLCPTQEGLWRTSKKAFVHGAAS